DAVATYLRDTDNLRTLDPSAVPGALASVYDVVNQTHPFREGNGRVQREFLTALARESGHRLDWTKVTLGRPGYESENDQASRLARTGDRGPLRAMFARITTKASVIDDHVNDALRLVTASRPPSTTRPPATGPAVARVNRPAPGAPGMDYGSRSRAAPSRAWPSSSSPRAARRGPRPRSRSAERRSPSSSRTPPTSRRKVWPAARRSLPTPGCCSSSENAPSTRCGWPACRSRSTSPGSTMTA